MNKDILGRYSNSSTVVFRNLNIPKSKNGVRPSVRSGMTPRTKRESKMGHVYSTIIGIRLIYNNAFHFIILYPLLSLGP